jgi:hypothetical protein
MFSNAAGNSYADWGLFGYYLNAEPYFTSRAKRNVWRFIVDQLRNELREVAISATRQAIYAGLR